MTSIRAIVTVKTAGLARFRSLVASGLGGGAGGVRAAAAGPGGGANPFDDWRRQVERRYSTFITRRFSTFSRGGGDWPALALSTIRARAGAARGRQGKGGGSAGGKGKRFSLGRETFAGLRRRGLSTYDAKRLAGTLVKTGRTVSILVDSGILRRAVGMDGVGHRTTRLPNGIQYGFVDIPHGTGRFAQAAAARKAAVAKLGNQKNLTLGSREAYQAIAARKKQHAIKTKAAGGRRGGVRGSAMTIGRLASIHHFGTRHIPRRTILVRPSPEVMAGMSRDLSAAVRKAIQLSRSGGGR